MQHKAPRDKPMPNKPMHNKPWLSLGLAALMAGLFLLPAPLQSALYLNTDQTSGMALFTWLSGHFIHVDLNHLGWNAIAFAVLGSIIEARSRALLLASLAVGIGAVNLLLLSPLADIAYYCGLSGALNTLWGLALWLLWRETHSPWLLLLAIGSGLKIALELFTSAPLFSQPGWPPYPLSHLAGFLAAPLLFGPASTCTLNAHKEVVYAPPRPPSPDRSRAAVARL